MKKITTIFLLFFLAGFIKDVWAQEKRSKAHKTKINALAFSQDETMLASTGWRTIKIWEVSTGSLQKSSGKLKRNTWSLSFTPDGRYLVYGVTQSKLAGGLCPVSVWDFRDSKAAVKLKKPTSARAFHVIAFSPSGDRMVLGNVQGGIYFVDALNWSYLGKLKEGYFSNISHIVFSPDGKKIAGSSSSGAFVADAETREIIKREKKGEFAAVGWENLEKEIVLDSSGHIRRVGSEETMYETPFSSDTSLYRDTRNAAISQKGDILVILKGDLPTYRMVDVWDIAAGKSIMPITPLGIVSEIAISSSGRYVAVGDWDGSVQIWDIKSKKMMHNLYDPELK